jgi:hypothetical protein
MALQALHSLSKVGFLENIEGMISFISLTK